MAISLYKMKKWSKMLLGNSIHHVNQGVGRHYSKSEIAGYYNDLSEKVLLYDGDLNEIPKTYLDTGKAVYFSIAIFQHGLGAYDLYLDNSSFNYLEIVKKCADWAVEVQNEDGSWETFTEELPETPFSAMAQGEGISLLVRAFKETKDKKYYNAAIKAKEYMLIPVEQGGTTKYSGEDVFFLEYTAAPVVLNGWIFSLWGLMDYVKLTDDRNVDLIINQSINTMERCMDNFNISFWSKYDSGERVCSPFYHKLHIAQFEVMYDLTGRHFFKTFADKWEKQINNKICVARAFVIKALQKIKEK